MTKPRKVPIPLLARYILLAAYTLLISYLCLMPPGESSGFQIWDKAAHAMAYTGFALLCCLIAANIRQLAILISLCFLFGIAIELLQGLTSYREASINDQIANAAGLLIGCALAFMAQRLYPLPAFQRQKR